MKILPDDNKNIAIGLVNPKTTSLFYDKIWIPDSLKEDELYQFEYGIIPNDVRIMGARDVEEQLYYGNSYGTYSIANNLNQPYRIKNYPYVKYITSSHRNMAILIATRRFKEIYGLDVAPFFFEYTDFEQAFDSVVNIGFIDFEGLVNKKYLDVIKFTVDNISKVVEDKLTWEQVLDFRHDKDSVKKLRKFKHWCIYDLKGKTANEVSEILNESYEEYCYVLKKHGIKTVVGSLSTLLTSISTIISMINAGRLENIATGFALSASLLTYAVHCTEDYLDYKNRKEPIAYIYDIIKESNKSKR